MPRFVYSGRFSFRKFFTSPPIVFMLCLLVGMLFAYMFYEDNFIINKVLDCREPFDMEVSCASEDIESLRHKTHIVYEIHKNMLYLFFYLQKPDSLAKYRLSSNERQVATVYKNKDNAFKRWKKILIKEDKNETFMKNKGEQLGIQIGQILSENLEQNEVMYVCIHEVAHMLNTEKGHNRNFWIINKLILNLAADNGIYKYKDYAKHPFKHNNLVIDHNILDMKDEQFVD